MIENTEKSQIYKFGDFLFDTHEKILRRGAEAVSMPPKTCELLAVLLENQGRLLTKDELFALVWADAFVEEANLSHHIAVLRKTLGEGENGRKFIETVPRRGYRFVAPVNQAADDLVEITLRERTSTQIIEEKEVEFAPEEIAAINVQPPKQITDGAAAVKQSRRAKWPLIGLTVLSLAVVGFGVYWLFLRKTPIVFKPENVKRLTTNGRATAPKISPDGRYIFYIQRDGGERAIWIRQIATGSDVQITPPTPTEDIYGGLMFSRDGDYVYYSLKRKGEKYSTLYQVPALGGTPKKILENLIGAVSFSPDGQRFAFLRPYPEQGDYVILTANADGTNELRLAARKRPNQFNGSLSWSPDGQTILCGASGTDGGFHYEFIAVRVSDGEMKTIRSRNWQSAESIVWLPDGHGFLLLGQSENSTVNQIWQVSYPGGETQPITNDTNHYGSLGLTVDGKFLVANKLDEESHVWLMNLNQESEAKQLTGGDNNYDGLNGIAWLPDGQIAYQSKASGDAIWLMTAEGKNPRKLTNDLGADLAISPDGHFVVFQSRENDSYGLWRVNTGDGSLKRLTEGVDFTPEFSRDGQWVYFSRFQDQTNLWRVSIEGGEAQQLTDEFRTTSSPALSPDGKTLALAYGRALKKPDAPPSGLALINLETNQILQTFDVPEFKFGGLYEQPTLQWTPDGSAVNFLVLRDGVSNIWQQRIDGGSRTQITNFKEGRIFNFAFSPDGQQIALARGKVSSDVVLIENAR